MADKKTCPHCGKPVPPTALGDLCPECMLKAGLATQTEGPGATGPYGTKVVHPPPSLAEIASLFPQLEIIEYLGRGGMGVVYKARQPRLNRLVALKILAREKEQDAQFAERFTREAQALARLNHPNIVTVYDFGSVGQASRLPGEHASASVELKTAPPTLSAGAGETPALHYLVMEFVDGLNLRQLLQARKMPPEQALTIVPKICEALQYAHEQGIVHRDIKPENILLDKQGRVKIADFGIAKMLGDESGQQTLTGARDAVGTPHYMAPEQIEKPLLVDHRADIYSLGVVFYEMLTGELPLGKFQPPSRKVQIDVRLDEVVLHALEKEPERRYQQASQVKTAVETIAATAPGGAANAERRGAHVTGAQIEAARNRLKAPARGLIAAGVLQLLFSLGLMVFTVPAVARESGDLLGCAVIGIIAAFFMIPAVVVLLGATNMLKLRRHTLTVVASVIAAVAGPAAVLGLPFGIWALVVLNRREVREVFEANQPPSGSIAAADSRKMDFARSQVRGPAIGLVVTGVLDWAAFTVACIIAAFKSASSMFIWLPFLAMALSGCVIYAGLKFMQLERRGAVILGSVLAMLVSPGNLIGLPLGIWALVVLNRYVVREAFEANRQRADKTTPMPGENQHALTPAANSFSQVLVRFVTFGLAFLFVCLLLLLGMSSEAIGAKTWSYFRLAIEIFAGILFVAFLSVIYRAITTDTPESWRAVKSWMPILVMMVMGILFGFWSPLLLKKADRMKSDYIGQTWFPQGDSIEISSVERNRNQMTVKGHYDLVSHDKAELALYITVTNENAPEGKGEIRPISKGRGDFTLVYLPLVPGLPHISMYADGHPFASLYFGTKAEALEERKASWITNASRVSSELPTSARQAVGASSEATNANSPRVISVSPADGATNVDTQQEIRIRFDRPMNPNDLALRWVQGGFHPDGWPRYESNRNEFVIPVWLAPGCTNEPAVNLYATGFGGFRGTNSALAQEYRWHFTTQSPAAKSGGFPPKVVRVSPAPGETLPVLTLLKITFDQPMMPPSQSPPYLRTIGRGGWSLPALIPSFDYDAASHTFTVPALLPPDNETRLTLEGFRSADGLTSEPVVVSCQIGTNNYSAAQQDQIAAATKDPQLEQLLSSMKAARARLTSGVETVQSLSLFGQKESLDNEIMSHWATFKWQGTNQVCADLSDVMGMTKAFILGTDGKTCWLYSEDEQNGRRLDRAPIATVADLYTSVADPFGLTKRTVESVLAKERLIYEGQGQLEGRPCFRVQSWMIRQSQNEPSGVSASKLEWWTDAKTFLPLQVVQCSTFGYQIFRFHYDDLNRPLPIAVFQPPVAPGAKLKSSNWFERKLGPDDKRFLTINDGCDGRMSGRLGVSGPGGTTSSGLN